MKKSGTPDLILIDSHTLHPHSVQGFQFLCRAVSFAEHWPAGVRLLLPGSAISETRMLRATGLERWPSNLEVQFGPTPLIRLGPFRIKSKNRFRGWASAELRKIAARSSSSAMAYFRTIKLAVRLDPLLKNLGIRYFFEPHEIFFESARHPEAFREIERKIYEGALHLYPISSGLAAALKAQFQEGSRLTVAPLGHTGTNLRLPSYDPAAEPRLLFTGSLLRWKGLETVLAAARALDLPFDIVGDAGGRVHYENFCREHGYSHAVFHGHVAPEELHRFYRPGSICVLPLSSANIAMNYTSPLKLFEYLASGRPVAAGDVPSVREIVQNKMHAVLLETGNVEAWTRGLRDLVNNRAAAKELGERGRALSMECTWSRRAKRLTESFLSHLS